MKKIITLLLVTLLASGGISAQTYKASTSTLTTAPVSYNKAGTDAAIAAQAKAQATIDAKQDAALTAAVVPIDTAGKFLKLIAGKLTVLQDACVPVLQNNVVALQSQDKATGSAVATLQAQNTALQSQLLTQQSLIDKLTTQVSRLQAVIDKLKIALQ